MPSNDNHDMDKLRKILEQLLEQLRLVDNLLFEAISKIKANPNSPQDIVLIYQISKIHRTTGAIIELLGKGYGLDAAILLRSILNNIINAKWIMLDKSEERATDFVWDAVRLQKKFVTKVDKGDSRDNFKRMIREKAKSINLDQLMQQYEERFHKKNRVEYKNVGIEQKANDVDLEYDYQYIYFYLSSQEHSDILSSGYSIKGIDDKSGSILIGDRQSTEFFIETSIALLKYVLQGIGLLVDRFQSVNEKVFVSKVKKLEIEAVKLYKKD